MTALHQESAVLHPMFRTLTVQRPMWNDVEEDPRDEKQTSCEKLSQERAEHDTDDETASVSCQQDGETHPEPITPTFDAAEVFRTNARKVRVLVALKKRFGIDSKELVEREKRSDRQYRRRSMDLGATFMANPEYVNVVYDWGMPLFHEPPSNKEVFNLKSCIAKEGKNTGTSHKTVHWPSRVEALCYVKSVVGYDESMIESCFYNGEDFNNFRLDKFIEDHPDEYEWVTEEEEYEEYEEVIEEIVYEYYEEEVIDEVPTKPAMSRRTSL